MLVLLFQLKDQIGWLTAVVGGFIGLCVGVAAFFVTRTYYRSGLEEKLTTKYRGLYEAEKADNDRLTREKTNALQAKAEAEKKAEVAESERLDILGEYTQLTQLFAKKSVILEGFTGIYSKMAEVMQSGDAPRIATFMRFLAATPPPPEDIHKTNPGGG